MGSGDAPVGVECADWREIEFFVDNLLVRVHFIIVMIRWTGHAPPQREFSLRMFLHANRLFQLPRFVPQEVEIESIQKILARAADTGHSN